MSLNIVILEGHLGKDPEMKYSTTGKPFTKFSIATNEKWTGADGVAHENVDWHNIACWGRLAEVTNQYLHKGSHVIVEGSLHYNQYNDTNTGEKKYFTQVKASKVTFLDRRGDGNNGGGETAYQTDEPAVTPVGDDGGAGGYDGPPF